MRRFLDRIYTLGFFLQSGRPLFAMAQVDGLERPSLWLAERFARLVDFTYRIRRQPTPAELAAEWNRLMPRPREAFPVIESDDHTAVVEIRIHCPLRGTGNAEACWRAMAFDRALMRRAGGRLVVLESQSVTGGACCRLAIRREGSAMDDLTVAHPRWLGDDG